MRILVCGGRKYDDYQVLSEAIDATIYQRYESYPYEKVTIINGGAKGADNLAQMFAVARGCSWYVFNANWKRDGKAAGPIRNQRMLDEGKPDIVLAFEGGKGTADMVRRAKKTNVRVIEIG